MANNREISQFAGLVTVNDTTNQVSIGSTLNLSGGDLTVDKGSGTDAVLKLQMGTGSGATNESKINFANSSGSVLFDAAFDNESTQERFKISTDQAGEAITLMRNGNVGINSASPATALNIGEGGVLRLGNSTNSRFTSFFNDANFSEWTADVDPLRLRAQHSSAYIRFDTNGSERVRITGIGGSMGIGTNDPTQKLHVNGNIQCTAIRGAAASSGFLTLAASAGNTNIDTGLSVNASNGGGTMLVMAARNTSNGTATQSAVYMLQFYYNGDNTPAKTLIAGTDIMTIGQTGSNTLTVNCSLGNWSVSGYFAGYGIGQQITPT